MRRIKGEYRTPAAPATFAQLSFRRILSNRRSTRFPRKWDYPFRSIGSTFRLSVRGATNMRNRDLIRASEIGDWCFCRRAWYLNDRRTRPTLVQIEKRQAGIAYHERHGRVVMQSQRTMRARNFVLVVLLLLAVACWLTMRPN